MATQQRGKSSQAHSRPIRNKEGLIDHFPTQVSRAFSENSIDESISANDSIIKTYNLTVNSPAH